MKPIKTALSNYNFGPPPNADELGVPIGDLPCQFPVNENGFNQVVSVWEPSAEERAAIAAGHNIRLGVGWLGQFPPVSLGVTHEGAI
jgi:hypothetical protein